MRADGASEKDRTHTVETKVCSVRSPGHTAVSQEKHLGRHNQGSPSSATPSELERWLVKDDVDRALARSSYYEKEGFISIFIDWETSVYLTTYPGLLTS